MGKRARDIHTDRLLLGDAAVVSVEEAARWLPINDAEARDLLHDNDLIRSPDGRHRFVVWADVIAYIRGEPRPGKRPPPSRDASVHPPEGRVSLLPSKSR